MNQFNHRKYQQNQYNSQEQYSEANDLSEEQIQLINQNEKSLLESILQKTIQISLKIQQTKKLNYLYSQERKEKLIANVQIKNLKINEMKQKNRCLLKNKEDLLRQVNAKRKLLTQWKGQISQKKVQHCQNIEKVIMIQEIIKETKKTQEQNAKLQQKIKFLNPKIMFLKVKRAQLQKKQSSLNLQINKKQIELQYLKKKTISNKENQSYQANLEQIKIQKQNHKSQSFYQKQRKSTKETPQQRKSTQPNSQSKVLKQSKKSYVVHPFDFNLA